MSHVFHLSPPKDRRRSWARPGTQYDRLVRWSGLGLPVLAAGVALLMLIVPLRDRGDFSFMLSRDRVERAQDRMDISEAVYRGEDKDGRPFSIQAAQAVQRSSRLPIIQIRDVSARMTLDTGPAIIRARTAQLDTRVDRLNIIGPLFFDSADGFRLVTRDVEVDMAKRTMETSAPVDGRMRLGDFSGDAMSADMNTQTVVVTGNARLHIKARTAR